MQNLETISIKDISGVQIGHESDYKAQTGVTVLYFPEGAVAGCDISGGGPASRETPLLLPETAEARINAIVLSGGSAYGLAAADGVMRSLESHGIGYDTGFARVPLVCQSDIYDLSYGSAKVRPDAEMGFRACEKALSGTSDAQGNIGCGTGATVGKSNGMECAQKSGFGVHAIRLGELTVCAVVCVNALGDIFKAKTGEKIAGLMNSDRSGFEDSAEAMCKNIAKHDLFTGNTTIGAIITNAGFSKAAMGKIASMTRNAYARCIRPVGTMADGDTIYAASTGNLIVDINAMGVLAAEAMAQAIENAISNSKITDEEYLSQIVRL